MTLNNRDFHYCKHCQSHFSVVLDPNVSGDYLLVCPSCKWQHYRHFYQGVAIHCDIEKRYADPKIIQGQH